MAAPARLRMNRTALLLEHHQLTPADAPGVQLVVYTAAPGSETEQRLRRLAG